MEEKKTLYRASFRQTFAEFKTPSGDWKGVLGYGIFFTSLGLWLFYATKMWGNFQFLSLFITATLMYYCLFVLVYDPLPESFSKENREAQLRRILDLQMNPVQGISSKWDYEKDEWKK